MRRRRVGHVARPMDGNAVVEVHRVPHAPQRPQSVAGVFAVDVEHTARRLRDTAHVLLARLVERRTVRVGVVGDQGAPLLTGTRRDVGDERGLALGEHDHGLQVEVDLDVGTPRRLRPTRAEHDGVLHDLPVVVREPTGLFGVRPLQNQSLERPHGLLGASAELAVDRARVETEVLEALLHRLHIVAVRALAERLAELCLRDGRVGGNDHRLTDHRRNPRRGGARDRRRRAPCALCAVGATREPHERDHEQHAPGSDGRGPLPQ